MKHRLEKQKWELALKVILTAIEFYVNQDLHVSSTVVSCVTCLN